MSYPYPPFGPLVAVVGFHHHRGPEIESWFGLPPGEDPAVEHDWSYLPFMALADGAHASTEDFSYFTLRRKLPSDPSISQPVPASEDAVASASTAAGASADLDAAATIATATTSTASDVPEVVAPVPIHPPAQSDLTGTPRASTTETPSISRGTTPLPSRPRYGAGASVFAMSCTRQLKAEELLNRPSDVTRSTVQKSVVVLVGSRPGRFAGWRDKLGAVTRSWFMQRDFDDCEILKHFQESLADSERNYEDEPDHFLGISLRQFVYDFRQQALILFKCALLQPKMLFFGTKTEKICMIQFALISLIPGLIRHLEDCADPSLDTFAQNAFTPSSLRTSNRSSLLEYMGLPLQIFGKGGFFGPYTPLQQLDLLADPATESYIVGSTNTLLLQHKEGGPEVIVEVDEKLLTIYNQNLKQPLLLSAADRRWIDGIYQTIASTWDPDYPTQPTTHSYLGSEDFIRFQFEEYVLSLLAATKYQQYFHATPHRRRGPSAFPEIEGDPTADFSDAWMEKWKQTPNYALWNRFTDSHLFDIVEPRHPTAGGLSVEDIQRRFAQQITDLHLDTRVAAGREVLNKHLATGQKKVSTAFNNLWAEIEARREQQKERWGRDSMSTPPPSDMSQSRPQLAANAAPYMEAAAVKAGQASAAAAAAGQRATAYLSGWGAWASEKRKNWGARNTSATDLKADAADQGMEKARSPSPAARTGVNWGSKNGRSLYVSTGSGIDAETSEKRYGDATTPKGAQETLWDSSHGVGVGGAGAVDSPGAESSSGGGGGDPRTPKSPVESVKNGADRSNRSSLTKRMSGRFGSMKSTKSRERIVDGIGRIDAP